MYRKSTLLMINLQTKSTQMKLILSHTMYDITVKDALNNAIQEYITVAGEPLGGWTCKINDFIACVIFPLI